MEYSKINNKNMQNHYGQKYKTVQKYTKKKTLNN